MFVKYKNIENNRNKFLKDFLNLNNKKLNINLCK